MAALTTGENAALYVIHLNNLMGDNLWLKHSIPSDDHHIDNDDDDYDENDDNGDNKIEKPCSFLCLVSLKFTEYIILTLNLTFCCF